MKVYAARVLCRMEGVHSWGSLMRCGAGAAVDSWTVMCRHAVGCCGSSVYPCSATAGRPAVTHVQDCSPLGETAVEAGLTTLVSLLTTYEQQLNVRPSLRPPAASLWSLLAAPHRCTAQASDLHEGQVPWQGFKKADPLRCMTMISHLDHVHVSLHRCPDA